MTRLIFMSEPYPCYPFILATASRLWFFSDLGKIVTSLAERVRRNCQAKLDNLFAELNRRNVIRGGIISGGRVVGRKA